MGVESEPILGDAAVAEVNALLEIPAQNRATYGVHLRAAVRDLQRAAASTWKAPRRKDVADYLDNAQEALTAVQEVLTALQRGGPGEEAGFILEMVGVPRILEGAVEVWIDAIRRAKVLATENPATRLPERPVPPLRGARGYEAFIWRTVWSAIVLGGTPKCYRDSDTGEGKGNYLKVLGVIKDHLPAPRPADSAVVEAFGKAIRAARSTKN